MTNHFIFDVDGTLTPSRGLIDSEFSTWFFSFCIANKVSLVTGSDVDKTIEQLGESIFRKVISYNCSGNETWEYGELVDVTNWKPSLDLLEFLLDLVEESTCPTKTGTYIEIRTGMLNFSTVGRKANSEERLEYKNWDDIHQERVSISNKVKEAFPDLDCLVGGETGVDIYPIGNDKSQIIKKVSKDDRIIFFGDRMELSGNDYPLAQANISGINHHVKDWRHTWEILKEYDKMV